MITQSLELLDTNKHIKAIKQAVPSRTHKAYFPTA